MGGKGAVEMVQVKGLGQMPREFNVKYDGANFNDAKGMGRMRDESWVTVSCDRSEWFRDEFNMTGHKTKTGYEVEVAVNSEASVSLWKKGSVIFTYTETEKGGLWGMKAFVGDKDWFLCRPDRVIERISAGFRCFIKENNKDGFSKTAEILVNSLVRQKDGIASRASLYTPPKGDTTVLMSEYYITLPDAGEASDPCYKPPAKSPKNEVRASK